MSSVGYGDIVPRNNTETGFQLLVVITGLYATAFVTFFLPLPPRLPAAT